MSTTPQTKSCPKCGGPISLEAPQGLCPRCLLQQACVPTEAGKGPSAKLLPPTPEQLAAAFPQLEIGQLIGQGGMGVVFKARQPKLDRFVALKILQQSMAADPAFAERFAREGRMLARLNHPNIVAIYDFGQAGGFFYLLMEFVDGVNLRQAMKVGRFTPAQALAVVPKICEALQYAHNEGILHRDIKPENILLDTKGRVKIADFGIAKLLDEPRTEAALTASGALLGTPHYMAPEQLEQSGDVDQRADIYSLGVVFYEMLTGELPLGRFQPPSHKAQVDLRLDEVVLHALEKEPARRYQQVSQVKTAVDTILTTPPSAAQAGNPSAMAEAPESTSAPDRFWRRFAVAAAIIFLAMLLVASLIWAPPGLMASKRAAALPAVEEQEVQPTNPPTASSETWSPNLASLAPGEKLEPRKVLDVARELTREGSYEEALQRYLWYHHHAREFDSHASFISALFDWVELGRRYPKAKQALIEIRDRAVREFQEDRGYSELFQQVALINAQLQQDEATYALFKTIQDQDPNLARQCYFYAESLLVAHGDYELCLSYMGDPQDRYNLIRRNLEMERGMLSRSVSLPVRNLRFPTNEGAISAPGAVPVPVPPPPRPIDTSERLLKSAQNRFVGQVCQLIEILVGTAHQADAEQIRDQALAVMADPRLESALSDAEERVRKVRASSSPASPKTAVRPSPQASFNSNLAKPSVSIEQWAPALAPGEKPDLNKLLQEAKELVAKEDYEAALQRHLWYHHHALEYDAGQRGVRLSFALSDWTELARRYPKAKMAMLEIRDGNTRELVEGRGSAEVFGEVAATNDQWGNDDATCALFQFLGDHAPALAKQCYRVAEPLLVKRGEYRLCLGYIPDYQAKFDSLRQSWERGKKWEERTAGIYRKSAQVSPSTGLALPGPPRYYDPHFVEEVRQLIAILVGTGHTAEAQQVRDQAVVCLDDSRLKSAVEDAQKTRHS